MAFSLFFEGLGKSFPSFFILNEELRQLPAETWQILEKALRGSVLCKPVVDDLLAPNSEDRAKLLACFASANTLFQHWARPGHERTH